MLEKQLSTVITKPREVRRDAQLKHRENSKKHKSAPTKDKQNQLLPPSQPPPPDPMPERTTRSKKTESSVKGSKSEKSKNKENKIKENKKDQPEAEKSVKRPSKRMDKLRKGQSLIRIVHGQAGPLTPIIDESPRNSMMLANNNSSTDGTPGDTPSPKIGRLKWNKSDSEVRTVIHLFIYRVEALGWSK